MKRFLVFVIICIVSLGIGFTVFRFMSYDEIITVSQSVFQVNVGDEIKLDVITEHLKNGTVITTEVTQSSEILQKYDDYTYMAKSGGQAVITLSSSSDMTPINIQVTVGNGSANAPYFIKNAEILASIGKTDAEGKSMPLTASYSLTSDISLLGTEWTPIGNEDANGFTGRFDFNGHTISGLTINNAYDYAGLFAKIGSNAEVFNGKISTATISSSSNYVGALAGLNAGDINDIEVLDSSITNTKQDGVAGGLVGYNTATIYKTLVNSTNVYANATNGIAGGLVGLMQTDSIRAGITLSGSDANVSANAIAGGLVGKIVGATVENCYAGSLNSTSKISSSNSSCYIGGVVGYLANKNTTVSVLKDTYAVIGVPTSNPTYVGAILGKNVDGGVSAKNKIFGNYYSTESSGVSNAVAGLTDPTSPESNDYGVYNASKQSLINDIPTKYKDEEKVTPLGTYYSCVSNDSSAYYYWDFENTWQSNAGSNQMPTIKEDAKYTTTNLDIAGKDGAVNSVTSFTNMDNNGSYALTGDFTIDRSSNYTPRDFHGSLIGETKEDGTPAWTITIVVDSDSQIKNGTFALFNLLGKNAIIQNINVNITVENVAVNKVAALAIENKGKILNCSSAGSIKTGVSNVTEYMAGIVVENYGIVQDSNASVNLTLNGAPTSAYIGGLVAYNYSNSIVESSRFTGSIATSTDPYTGYVGGIVGQSDSKVTYCVNTGSINCQGNLKKCYIGGLVGHVNGSYLSKSSNLNNTIRGTNVGGVAGFTSGYITECMSKSTLIGDHVGGLICEITKNFISNCAAYNHLDGVSDSSVIAGMGYFFVINGKTAYAEKVFCANTFGKGKKYYETPSGVRGETKITLQLYENCAEYCIYVKDIVSGGAKRSVMDFEWVGWMFGYYYDTPVTDAQAKGSDNYSKFYDNGYSTDIWSFADGEYPQLKNVAR